MAGLIDEATPVRIHQRFGHLLRPSFSVRDRLWAVERSDGFIDRVQCHGHPLRSFRRAYSCQLDRSILQDLPTFTAAKMLSRHIPVTV